MKLEPQGNRLLKASTFRYCQISFLICCSNWSSEGDNLEIRKEYIYKSFRGQQRSDLYDYLSFIYWKGKWVEDYYNFFTDKTRLIRRVKVEFKNKQ